MSVKVKVVRIGNSKGIRIPKTILEECHLKDTVELQVREGKLLVKSPSAARLGWDESYARMAEARDDALIDSPAATDWDKTKWRW